MQKVKQLIYSRWHLLVLASVFFATSYALFQPALFKVHDYVHGVRIAQMTLALKDGHFPVIWTRDFGFGYGMPLFEFYAPLPYYVGSLVYILGFSLTNAVKSLFLLANFFTLLGAYLLGRDLFKNKLSGVLVASAFTLASYRALNLFVRGAISESWGIMAYPWILWGSLLVIKRKRLSWLVLTLALASLFLSHNLSVVMFLPFAVVWTLGVWLLELYLKDSLKALSWKKVSALFKLESKTLFKFVGSYLLAFALAAFYTLPAFLEKDFTQMKKIILSGYFDYHLHFLYLRQFLKDSWGYEGSTWGPNDGISFFLGWGQLAGLALVIALSVLIFGFLILKWVKEKKWPVLKRQAWFGIFGLFLSLSLMDFALILTTQKSLFLWNSLGFLKFLQFPWRYLSVAILFLALALATLPLLIDALLSLAKTKPSPKLVLKTSLVLGLGIVFLTLITSWQWFRPKEYLKNDDALYYDDRGRTATHMSEVLPDYVPSQFNVKIKPNQGQVLVQPRWLTQSDDKFKVLVDKTQASLVVVNLPKQTRLVFARAYYPGWRVEIDGLPASYQVTKDGLIAVYVPKDEHKIGVYLGDTNVRLVGKLISLVGIIVLVGALIKDTRY